MWVYVYRTTLNTIEFRIFWTFRFEDVESGEAKRNQIL